MKNKFILAFLIFFSSLQIFAVSSQTEKNFIKASLAEKITIVKNLKEKDLVSVTQKALDFSIENSSVLKDDKDLTNLALACVLVLPSDAESIKKLKKFRFAANF
jgi:2-phospho-L-lactate guanylyltransferase (CobY/MobA/RfbA family)